MLPTKKDYRKLKDIINLALQQLEPDGNCCAICGDNDHQAWECHHNPVSKKYKAQKFKCFHCGEIFADEKIAKQHFGDKNQILPECQTYEDLEKFLSKFPSTWYPALLIHIVKVAHNKNVFLPYGATRIIRKVEKAIERGEE